MQNLKLFNPDFLQHLCQKYNLRPSKQYGQNFLINPEPIEVMLEAGEVKKTDTIVEVGPGFGVLTLALAEQAKKVISFEIEKKLMPYWESLLSSRAKRSGVEGSLHSPHGSVGMTENNIEIVWGNVLHEVKSQKSKVKSPYKLIANLPYQITSPVIRTFLETENPPEVMVLMVQKEVAERICAKPGQMSLLSVSVQYYADAEIIAQVKRNNFWPEPAVDSAIIKIVKRASETPPCPPLCGGEEAMPPPLLRKGGGGGRFRDDDFFFKIVKIGFAQKRKLLIKNLEPLVGKKNKPLLIKALQNLNLLSTARAQELSVEQWVKLSQEIAKITQK